MTKKLQQIPLVRDLSVGDVAERAGVAVSTLHFYEAEGLIKGWRTISNHRRYGRDVLRRIAIIKVAQRAGIPLKEIQQALNTLPDGRTPTGKDWQRLATYGKRNWMTASRGLCGCAISSPVVSDVVVFRRMNVRCAIRQIYWGTRALDRCCWSLGSKPRDLRLVRRSSAKQDRTASRKTHQDFARREFCVVISRARPWQSAPDR